MDPKRVVTYRELMIYGENLQEKNARKKVMLFIRFITFGVVSDVDAQDIERKIKTPSRVGHPQLARTARPS